MSLSRIEVGVSPAPRGAPAWGAPRGGGAEVSALGRILLAEDNQNDVELTLAALSENSLANEVVVVRDGAEALEWLRRTGAYAARSAGNPVVVLLDLKMPKVDGIEVL